MTPCRVVDPLWPSGEAWEKTLKIGPEIELGPLLTVGGSIYKNMTTGGTGGKIELDLLTFGAELNRPTPNGGTITGSAPLEFSVHGGGYYMNLTTGEHGFEPSKSVPLGLLERRLRSIKRPLKRYLVRTRVAEQREEVK